MLLDLRSIANSCIRKKQTKKKTKYQYAPLRLIHIHQINASQRLRQLYQTE